MFVFSKEWEKIYCYTFSSTACIYACQKSEEEVEIYIVMVLVKLCLGIVRSMHQETSI